MFGSSQLTHPLSPFSSLTVHTLVGSTCTALQHMRGRAHQELGALCCRQACPVPATGCTVRRHGKRARADVHRSPIT